MRQATNYIYMIANRLIIIALLILVIACEKKLEKKYVRFDQTTLFRYEVGDTLIFRNSEVRIDTYRISYKESFFVPDYKETTFYEYLEVAYEKLPDDCEYLCPISSLGRGAPNYVSFTGSYYPIDLYLSEPTYEYNLGDTTLHDIYIIQEDLIHDTITHKVKEFYYSDNFGYIRYDLSDGSIFELQLE